MRVFAQINNCQQKKSKQTNQQNKKGAPLLGLAKSIYYRLRLFGQNQSCDTTKTGKHPVIVPT